MKKSLLLFLIIITVFSGCQNPESVSEDISTTVENERIIVNVPTIDKKNAELVFSANGVFSEESVNDIAIVTREISSDLTSQAKLIVKTKDIFSVYNIGDVEKNPFNHGSLVVADVDNDNIDEILFYSEITGNGATVAKAFRVIDSELEVIEDFSLRNDFTFAFEDGYILKIINDSIGFVEKIDLSKKIPLNNFDENGVFVGESLIKRIPVSNLSVDCDSEDRVVVKYSQGVIIGKYLGEVEVSLKWDSQKNSFSVVDIDVITNQGKINQGTAD